MDNTINKLLSIGREAANKVISDPKHNMSWIGSYDNLPAIKEHYERILKDSVWKQFEKEVIQDLSNLSINIESGSAGDFDRTDLDSIEDAIEEGTVEGNDGQIDKSYDDFSSFQMDSKDTASWRVKLALSTIKSGERNFLGTAVYLPFDTVFDDLQDILS